MSEPANDEKRRVVAERLRLWAEMPSPYGPEPRHARMKRAPDFLQPAEAWRLHVALRNDGARLYYRDWQEVQHRVEIRYRTLHMDTVSCGMADTVEQALLDAAFAWAKGAEGNA